MAACTFFHMDSCSAGIFADRDRKRNFVVAEDFEAPIFSIRKSVMTMARAPLPPDSATTPSV